MKANNGHPRMAKVANGRIPLQPAPRQTGLFYGLLCEFLCGLFYVTGAAQAALPEPQDVPYPGVIRLHVDATDLAHRVFRVTETVPVTGPGRVTLLYPEWLPGNHAPTGPIDKLAGLIVRGNGGARIEWRRDATSMHAFHVDVPAGVSQLDLQFEYVTPTDASQWRIVMTPDLLNLQWEKALLYPAGYFVRQIPVEASIELPAGWEFATALRGAQRTGNTVQFARASLETVVDSPLFAGAHYRRVELEGAPARPVRLNIFADNPGELRATDEQIEHHRRAVREAVALFGSRQYREYDFLLAISGHLGGIGLEHHESSENGVGLGYFTDWTGNRNVRDLLPHEMVHSWNGKFRRPADLWTPTYNVPMQPSLLWVYEGMTDYLGVVLAGRSGLWSPEFTREVLARFAANYDLGRAGRQWRNLQDTTQAPIINYRGRVSYVSWQRGKDYYTEGLLLWLDVDTRIRELSRGKRSLDDFAKAFFGAHDGRLEPLTYTFDDVVTTLNAVVPHDWAALLRARLDGHGPVIKDDLASAFEQPARVARDPRDRAHLAVERDRPAEPHVQRDGDAPRARMDGVYGPSDGLVDRRRGDASVHSSRVALVLLARREHAEKLVVLQFVEARLEAERILSSADSAHLADVLGSADRVPHSGRIRTAESVSSMTATRCSTSRSCATCAA